MGDVDLSDASLTSYHTTRKRLKKILSKVFLFFEFMFSLQKKTGSSISRMEFQVKLTENLISEYHITEERPLGGPPETAPPTRMSAPHYPSYIAATVSKQNRYWLCVICYKNGQHHEKIYN
jgi:hypothetical protein